MVNIFVPTIIIETLPQHHITKTLKMDAASRIPFEVHNDQEYNILLRPRTINNSSRYTTPRTYRGNRYSPPHSRNYRDSRSQPYLQNYLGSSRNYYQPTREETTKLRYDTDTFTPQQRERFGSSMFKDSSAPAKSDRFPVISSESMTSGQYTSRPQKRQKLEGSAAFGREDIVQKQTSKEEIFQEKKKGMQHIFKILRNNNAHNQTKM
jgi:hypothetical protein